MDNRAELGRRLGLTPAALSRLTDAQLALRCYQRWRERGFDEIVGPYALVVVDEPGGRVVCARDPLGGRPLLFHAGARLLLAASEEAALLAHPAVEAEVDEESAARFFSLRPPRPGSTFVAGLRELLPGQCLIADGGGCRLTACAALRPEPARCWRSVAEVGEAFRERLQQSVAARLRARGPAAVMMSGGLDSTAVAALACHGRPAPPLPVISWVFEELAVCDESAAIDAMAARFPLAAHRLAADSSWPLCGADGGRGLPGSPVANPYRELLDRTYGEAAAAGHVVLLTGWFADELLAASPRWWWALRRDRGAAEAAIHLGRMLAGGRSGWRAARAALFAGWRPSARHPLVAAPWLTDAGRRLAGFAGRRHREWASQLLGGLQAWVVREEAACAARYGVELRSPFRDRRLVELVLSLPEHWLHRFGADKYLLRQAMSGLLPERILRRRRPSSLTPLFDRGVRGREAARVASIIGGSGSSWQRFVRPEWLSQALARPPGAANGVESAVPWACIGWELWRTGRALEAGRRERAA